MNRLILKTRRCALSRSVLLAAIILLPVLWSNQANADPDLTNLIHQYDAPTLIAAK